MRRKRLAIGKDGQLSVSLPARLFQIGRQFPVKRDSPLLQRRILALCIRQHLLHGQAIALPVRPQLAAQVFNRVILGVRQQDMSS